MTDDHATFDPSEEPFGPPALTPQEDDLVSRVLDGDADDEQRRAVQADPRLRDRLELLERVRADLKIVEPVSDDRREATIAAAVAAAASTDAVTPIGNARSRRWRRGLGIAAAVAALVIGVPMLALTLGRGSETDTSTSADMAAPAADQAESGAAATSSPPVQSLAVVDLGVIDTDEQLRTAVDAVLADPSTYATRAADDTPKSSEPLAGEFATRGPADCAATATTDTPASTPLLTAVATWQGEPAVVVVLPGAPTVIVVQRGDCTEIARIDD
jgi:hypothetical protein